VTQRRRLSSAYSTRTAKITAAAPCLRSRRAYLRPCSALKVGQFFLSERKSSNPSQRRNGFVILSSAMVEEGRQP